MTEEQRTRALELIREGRLNRNEIAETIGVSRNTISSLAFRKKLSKRQIPASVLTPLGSVR